MIAEADPRYRDGLTKRPSGPYIKITYVNDTGERQEHRRPGSSAGWTGMSFVLTKFEDAEGKKIKDLPIKIPVRDASLSATSPPHDVPRARRPRATSGTPIPMWTTQIGSMSSPWPSSVTSRHHHRQPRH